MSKNREKDQEDIKEFGQVTLENSKWKSKIHLLSVIGEIEGHEVLAGNSKTTKYEHVIPSLAQIEDDKEIEGVLILINTIGGDVESGLAIAEMIASLSKPTVSLVLGGSHSIGVPLAVAADYSFIVPTGTMLIHPVRMSGMVIGARQTYEYFQRMQDRITGFIAEHSRAEQDEIEEMMMDTGYMTKDLGTILVGKEAVEAGIIDEVGGIKEAFRKLYRMIKKANKDSGKN
jgi:ATP-dependent protease ClpP protease subunit